MHGLECQELPYVNTEDCLFLKGEFSRFTLNIFDIFVHTCRMQLSYSSLKGAIILIMHCMCIFSSLRGMTSLELSCTVTKWSKFFFNQKYDVQRQIKMQMKELKNSTSSKQSLFYVLLGIFMLICT